MAVPYFEENLQEARDYYQYFQPPDQNVIPHLHPAEDDEPLPIVEVTGVCYALYEVGTDVN